MKVQCSWYIHNALVNSKLQHTPAGIWTFEDGTVQIPVPCAKIGSKRPAPHGQNNRSNVPTPFSPTIKIYRNYEVNKQNSIYLIIQCSFCSPYVCSHDVTKEHSFLIKCPQIFPRLRLLSASRFHNRFWIKFYPGSFSFLKPFYRGCCTELHLLRQFNTSNATPIFALRIGFGTSTDSTVTNHDNCW